jgi:hypothetical protein
MFYPNRIKIRNYGSDSGSRRHFNFGSSALGSGYTTLQDRPQVKQNPRFFMKQWSGQTFHDIKDRLGFS